MTGEGAFRGEAVRLVAVAVFFAETGFFVAVVFRGDAFFAGEVFFATVVFRGDAALLAGAFFAGVFFATVVFRGDAALLAGGFLPGAVERVAGDDLPESERRAPDNGREPVDSFDFEFT